MFHAGAWIPIVLGLLIFSGCASDTQDYRQLSQQQSATLSSLQKEVSRLNQELEEEAGSRDILESTESKVKEALAEEISHGVIMVALERRGLVITIQDRALFDAEETRIQPAAERFLDKISEVIAKDFSGRCIFIEGHTDDQPVVGPEGITNWEYSVDRAAPVLHYFVDTKGLPPVQFSVTGYGKYQPVASNKTEEGRDQNRRIVIVLSSEKAVTL